MKAGSRTLGLVGLAVVVVVAAAVIMFWGEKPGETLLYFNAESDLPDPLIYFKVVETEDGIPAHILDLGRRYNIVFSVASLENKPVDYTYIVESNLVNESDSFNLKPGESKTVYLTVSPDIGQKWVLNLTNISKRENFVDLTEQSWLAERREFTVIVREEGLPAIVEERYDLPISSSLESFGRVYHMNITLDELRVKPFEWSYVRIDSRESNRVVINDSVRLSVEGNKLHVVSTSRKDHYVSEPKLFRVKLTKKGVGSILINATTGLEEVHEINFLYRIR